MPKDLQEQLIKQRAHWVDERTLLWRPDSGMSAKLHVSADATLSLHSDGVRGGTSMDLESGSMSQIAAALFPHLTHLPAWQIPEAALREIPEWLRGQVAVAAYQEHGEFADATGVQLSGVLDDLYTYRGPLGTVWGNSGAPQLFLWAPTARLVRVHIFESSCAGECREVRAMERGSCTDEPGASGVWSLEGERDWEGKFYLFEVGVFTPRTGRIETRLVTDPYSRSLSMNGQRSQFVRMNNPALEPEGWRTLEKPVLDRAEDIALYELHIRDFSALEQEIPEEKRGTYLAFTIDAPPTQHLRRMRAAGITHIHLLPTFDIATINDDRATWPTSPQMTSLPPDSAEQQRVTSQMRDIDGYNWGYDPRHYGVPEGSYSTAPDGPQRILEFRKMVQSLNEMGLRVVLDVVYNHTHGGGADPTAVFDRIVPGYFHRLDEDGEIHTSTCCNNTASERTMFERFVADDLEHWARDYKIDGFRFDLMGHHMKRNLEVWQNRLQALTPESDGVDGSQIYLYGEGWDFGEVQGGARGANATQQNMAGTRIGTFNDRLRNAIRGGGPFGDPRDQGFATGLFVDPGFNGNGDGEKEHLFEIQDRVRIGLAGNLASYRFTDRHGQEATGASTMGTGYASEPRESIQYVSAHDNETLFDKIQFAASDSTSLTDRIRMQSLALSIVAFSQGIPFFHAGSEILRSKSFDNDSYNSGDWFNRLDFTYRDNGFGRGLPPAEKNRDRWKRISVLLARKDLKPSPAEIESALANFEVFLSIRMSSPVFRFGSAEEIQSRVHFHNTGRSQIPGLIVMSLDNQPGKSTDDRIWVFFNSRPEAQLFRHVKFIDKDMTLHPLQQNGVDDVVRNAILDSTEGSILVPGRTTAVFVESETS